MVKFNINEKVAIEVTESTLSIIRSKISGDENFKDEYMRHCIEPYIFTQNNDEKKYIWLQLWSVMYYFGDKMIMGCKPPIGTTMLIKKETLEN